MDKRHQLPHHDMSRAHCVTLTSGDGGEYFVDQLSRNAGRLWHPNMLGRKACVCVCVCVCNVFHSFSSPYINGLRMRCKLIEKNNMGAMLFFKLLLLLTSPHHTQSGLSAIASGEGFHIHKDLRLMLENFSKHRSSTKNRWGKRGKLHTQQDSL